MNSFPSENVQVSLKTFFPELNIYPGCSGRIPLSVSAQLSEFSKELAETETEKITDRNRRRKIWRELNFCENIGKLYFVNARISEII
jgi:hypothetical protein